MSKNMNIYEELDNFVEKNEGQVTLTDIAKHFANYGYQYAVDKYGRYFGSHFNDAECLLFPSKNCRTWEGWTPPTIPKFKIGDWLYHNKKGVYPILITDYDEKLGYQTECLSTKTYLRKEFVEKEYHLWSIEDAKDGDVLVNDAGCIFINAGFEKDDKVTLVCYCYVSVQGIFYEEDYKTGSWLYVSHVHPATKEQRDLLFKKMKEAGYQWDEENKELRKIKPHYNIENFSAGMPVLVRIKDDHKWCYLLFSHCYKYQGILHFCAGGAGWLQCIPFKGNEKLVGTSDMCPEEFINW